MNCTCELRDRQWDGWRCQRCGKRYESPVRRERINTGDLFFGNDLKGHIASAEERLKTLEPGQVFRLEDLEGEVN